MLKYQSIAADIQHSIEDGSLKPNDKLPTVVELCQIYDVSKITVKRAFDVLVEKGLISSKRGSGTYVKSAQTVTSPRGASAGFTAEVGSLGFTRSDRARGFTAENEDEGEVTSVVYEFSVINPPERVTQYLGIQPDDFTYRHCRVRCLNDVPIVIEYTYMPLELIPGLKRSQLYVSVYDYLQNTLGLKISSFHRILRAVPATEEEAERLNTKPGVPMLEIAQVGFLDDGTPFEYSVSRYEGTRGEIREVNVV